MNTDDRQAQEINRLWTQKLVLLHALSEIKHGCWQEIKESDLPTSQPSVCPYAIIDIINEAFSTIQKGDSDAI